MKQWYVLYVMVRHEKRVYEKLLKQQIECYLPLIKKVKQWSDRKKTTLEPLFTGYVFVCLLPHELDKPRYINGVVNYLSFGNNKALVKQSEIEALQYLIEKGYSINSDTEGISVGTKVKLTLSNFKEEIATVHSIKDRMAVVYFESLNQFFKLRIPIEALKKINS